MNTASPNDGHRNADVGAQALVQTLRAGFNCLRLLMLMFLVLYMLSGVFVVRPHEQAFILRFGAVVGDTREEQIIDSGEWRWAWPRPIDQVIRAPVKKTQTVHSDHFWYGGNAASGGPNGDAEAPLIPGVDGYLLTGDSNIIHAQWSLVYTIANPVYYYATCGNPEDFLSKEFERIILHETARATVRTILFHGAEDLRLRIQEQLAMAAARMEIGVDIKNVSFAQRTPPRSTISSFHQVLEAEQEKNRQINAARTEAARIVKGAEGLRAQIIARAESYRKRIVADVVADADYFETILAEFRRSPRTTLIALYTDALTEVLENVERKFVIHPVDDAGQQEIRLEIGPEPPRRDQ